MREFWGRAATALMAFALALPMSARAEETTVDEIVAILKQKGLIDDATEQELLMKHHKEQASVDAGPLEGFKFGGDIRLREESFWYSKGMNDEEARNRNRFRFRTRLGFTKEINDWLMAGVRVVTNTGDYRSTNISFGDNDDFNFGDLSVDRVYLTAEIPTGSEALKASFTGGKMPNVFTWKAGPDFVVWDHDIQPEGGVLQTSYALNENTRVFGNFGAFIPQENSSASDLRVYANQVGATTRLNEELELGLRGSFYLWVNSDSPLQSPPDPANPANLENRSFNSGNIIGDDGGGMFDNGRANVGGLYAYTKIESIEDWPVLLFGTVNKNFSADSTVVGGDPVDAEELAWGLGAELGSAKKCFKLGFGYYEVEANSVVAQYTDSDLFDGFTNRKGWQAYISRQIAENVDFRVEFFDGEEIEDDPGYSISSSADSKSDRRRLRTDVVVKF